MTSIHPSRRSVFALRVDAGVQAAAGLTLAALAWQGLGLWSCAATAGTFAGSLP